ncbi:trypsin-like serine protease [Streptomyces echinoruber]|uniref:Peptidase S1 domain-containing protein n=1 Tax=Streptomyces echinoruber TaxID=68898 RepID=A0A918VGZ8_9ACTN|nr:trypsin-like serine protease [Streptomyces echinoruber]GGZ98157.1 hypothetical protein GCM10010389_41830 [Streptomyces echinoruber]
MSGLTRARRAAARTAAAAAARAAGAAVRVPGRATTCTTGGLAGRPRTATAPLVPGSHPGKARRGPCHGSGSAASDTICPGHPSGGVDTCQGDSGGPLLSGGVLAGITSRGGNRAGAGRPEARTRPAGPAAFPGRVRARGVVRTRGVSHPGRPA